MLADGHFTDRVADADDVVTLGKVHRIFAGGLLHRYLFHPDAYHAVDFELATGRSILDDDLALISTESGSLSLATVVRDTVVFACCAITSSGQPAHAASNKTNVINTFIYQTLRSYKCRNIFWDNTQSSVLLMIDGHSMFRHTFLRHLFFD